jgi:hypothetical protein
MSIVLQLIINNIDLCMIIDDKKHKIWLSCMKLSNCTPADAVNFINLAEDFLS